MERNKFKKGELLVETIVAMTVFVMLTMVSFEAYKTFAKIAKKENEYIFFESVCYSIDELYDNLGKEFWAQEYFGEYYYFIETSNYGEQRYATNFELVETNDPRGIYVLTYTYEDDNLIIDIENTDNGNIVIAGLEYGPSAASSKNDADYYQQIGEINYDVVQHLPQDKYEDYYGGVSEDEEDEDDEDLDLDDGEVTPEESGEENSEQTNE